MAKPPLTYDEMVVSVNKLEKTFKENPIRYLFNLSIKECEEISKGIKIASDIIKLDSHINNKELCLRNINIMLKINNNIINDLTNEKEIKTQRNIKDGIDMVKKIVIKGEDEIEYFTNPSVSEV